jgi:membrane protease YdiL (CAAX protease family)
MDSVRRPWRRIGEALACALVVAAVAAFLWVPHWSRFAFAALALATVVASHHGARERPHALGWRLDTAPAAALYLLPVVVIAAVLIATTAAQLGTSAPANWLRSEALVRLPPALLSGCVQQHLLLAFLYRRCQEWLPDPVMCSALTVTVFAALHMPNGFLVLVTFVGGWISCAVYRRAPNLLLMGLAHGLIVYLLEVSLPSAITGGMRVGIEFGQP